MAGAGAERGGPRGKGARRRPAGNSERGMGMAIAEVERTVSDFVKNVLNKKGRIIKVERNDEGWEAQAEVIEENQFIRALGLPTTVYDKNFYLIRLDHELQVISYDQFKERLRAAEESAFGR